MTFRTIAAGLVCAAAALPATASADSLVFVRDGNVFVSGSDGSGAKQITTDGGYESPSQADDGTIVAGRQTQENGRTPRRLHRMDREGRALNAPVVTVPVDNSFYIGPLQPKVSPDGRFVAYHYLYTGPLEDETEPKIAWSHSDRDTVNGTLGTNAGYMNPSWTQDGRTLAFYAAERTTQVDVQNVNGPVANWFADPDVKPLLLDGELSAAGDRLAALGNDTIRLYDVPGGPLNAPVFRCAISAPSGKFAGPTWSPDGRTLAWQEADGIHAMRVDDLGACGSAARPLIVPGGADPDFGPAAGPAVAAPDPSAAPRTGQVPAGQVPAGGVRKGPKVTLKGVRASLKASALRRGVKVAVRCAAACRVSAKLVTRRRTVATASARGKAGKDVRLKLRARRPLTGKATLTITATGADGGRTVLTRKMTVKR